MVNQYDSSYLKISRESHIYHITIPVFFSGNDSTLDDVGKLSQKLKSAIEDENIRFVEKSLLDPLLS